MLESEVASLRTHATLARGVAGEKLIAKASGGQMTLHTAAVDVVLKSGATIEVKASKITESDHKWQWNKIFGQNGSKTFDYLTLVGDADPKSMQSYAYPAERIVFLIPRAAVEELCGTWWQGVAKINLTPNPLTARGRGAMIYRYQVDPSVLEQHISVASEDNNQ